MNYSAWAEEYLEEAARIRQKITALRQSLKDADVWDLNEINRRIGVLYPMYLELRETGKLLSRHPQRRYDDLEKEESADASQKTEL